MEGAVPVGVPLAYFDWVAAKSVTLASFWLEVKVTWLEALAVPVDHPDSALFAASAVPLTDVLNKALVLAGACPLARPAK